MNFVKTMTWKFINWNDVSFCEYEKDNDNENGMIYPYFIMKNGEKIDAFETCNTFNIEENGQEYIFCIKCSVIYFEILIYNINLFFTMFPNRVYDIEKHEDRLWEDFVEKIKLEEYLETKNGLVSMSTPENNQS